MRRMCCDAGDLDRDEERQEWAHVVDALEAQVEAGVVVAEAVSSVDGAERGAGVRGPASFVQMAPGGRAKDVLKGPSTARERESTRAPLTPRGAGWNEEGSKGNNVKARRE